MTLRLAPSAKQLDKHLKKTSEFCIGKRYYSAALIGQQITYSARTRCEQIFLKHLVIVIYLLASFDQTEL
ncbi:MAG: hypothetical protein AVDCRST_MAG74-1901 [uncultured Pyrinomonadaceae bacterium]|uniref:Uncharacterized protein n=1 Tax=uncultured Pyrinomonadaceae bacterium TaxID=2283094 RepID=A0A6J4P5R0_9BACT|nr:MAG: hypothetical protein AVDCRST_MAG74-1901 [uncultured Pyrinomonadaceae bacterium]